MGNGKLLIVNADDFGISEGVNRGIAEAHRRGILTSTTVMANMPAFDHAVKTALENPTLGVGVHLNLTSGRPLLAVSRVPDLVGSDGRFCSLRSVLRRLTLGRPEPGQIEAELSAQVERVLAAGISPTHLDSHHHVHMHPRLQPVAIRVARRYGIRSLRCTAELNVREACSPSGLVGGGDYLKAVLLSVLGALLRGQAARAGVRVPDHFRGLSLGMAFSSERLRGVLERLQSGATELMCHPGYPDEDLRQRTSYADGREVELAALLDHDSRAVLERAGVRLIDFGALRT